MFRFHNVAVRLQTDMASTAAPAAEKKAATPAAAATTEEEDLADYEETPVEETKGADTKAGAGKEVKK